MPAPPRIVGANDAKGGGESRVWTQAPFKGFQESGTHREGSNSASSARQRRRCSSSMMMPSGSQMLGCTISSSETPIAIPRCRPLHRRSLAAIHGYCPSCHVLCRDEDRWEAGHSGHETSVGTGQAQDCPRSREITSRENTSSLHKNNSRQLVPPLISVVAYVNNRGEAGHSGHETSVGIGQV